MSGTELQNCQNCGKAFPTEKIGSHFAYCRRNIKKCPQCNELVDINHLDQHIEEEHSQEKCQWCRLPINAKIMDNHKKVCTKKPVVCAYCQQSVPVENFEEHQHECGSRTKNCIKCQKSVLLRQYDFHEATCQGLPTPATAKAYTNYNDYLKKQREQLGMEQKAEIKAPVRTVVEKIRVVDNGTRKPGQVLSAKHEIKDLGTRVVHVSEPRPMTQEERQQYFGSSTGNGPIKSTVRSYNPTTGTTVTYNPVTTTTTTRVSGQQPSTQVIRHNTISQPTPTVTYARTVSQPVTTSYTSHVTYPASSTYQASTTSTHGGYYEDEDPELQRALMQSLGYS